jgi:hypothetical protein
MTSQPIRRWAASGLLAGALALCGCGSGDDATTSANAAEGAAETATPLSNAALPDDLRGSWKRTMRPRDWKSVGRGYPLGTWRFDIARDGDLSVWLPRTDEVDFTTTIAVDGDQLTIDSIPICPGETGRYAWRAAADELTLTVVGDDACKPRAALFGGTWHRRG